MTWVKIDDGFADHPKLAGVGPLGMAMQVAALCYCNRKLTDGFVPAGIVNTLIDVSTVWDRRFVPGSQDDYGWTVREIVSDLVEVGIWEEADGGFTIHDFSDFQPSKEQVEREREATRNRVAAFRNKRNAVSNSVTPPLVTLPPVPVPKDQVLTSVKSDDHAAELRIYELWRSLHGKTDKRYERPSSQRLSKIRARRREFSDVELDRALRASAQDDWPDRRKHNDLTVLFRSQEKVEHWLEQGVAPVGPRSAAERYAQNARNGSQEPR